MAAKSISANKGRSALTMLGVIIGLAAVIILVSYAQGQNMALRAYYESMGTNTISVSAYSYRGNVDVASALYDYCLQLDDLVLGVSPTGYIYSDPVIKFESKTISRQWQNMGGGAMMSAGEYPQIVLGNDKYGLCSDYKIAKGRDLSYLDIEKENQVCVLGSALAINGQISFGVIVAFILYVRLFTSPLSTIAQGMTQMQTAAAAGDHIFDFLHEEELPSESGKRKAPANVRGEVEFEHVRFSYPSNPEKVIIKDFSAHIQPGQKVAIVGPTGAGKTTLVNLLMRFFEINHGSIRIDGISTADMTRESVHNLFSMVLQDTWLFEGTVRENLIYNKSGVSDQQLEAACRACGIYHFVETLPSGFDTVLDDSIAISAGQKQLLTIARAMIQGNPMLILDEATSSVDTRTELITQKAMDQLTKHRTSFVIAHRLSTIRNADLILVLKDGDIIEQGTHEDLLAQGGFYADLYNSQFEKTA